MPFSKDAQVSPKHCHRGGFGGADFLQILYAVQYSNCGLCWAVGKIQRS